jgi:hypothetical protein
MTILAVDNASGPATQVTTDGPSEAKAATGSGDHLVLEVDAASPTVATVALAWSPKWHGSVNGKPVELRRTQDGLVAVDLRQGISRIQLDFRHDQWDVIGLTISLLCVFGGPALVAGRRRRSGSDPGAELQPGQDAGQLRSHL